MLVDPLFQRTLINVVRRCQAVFAPEASELSVNPGDSTWTGLPVVADEVFTGLYRLGHASSSQLLGVQPDIAVYAKLLTGGLLPLSCTVASESVFDAFLAEGKSDALLHGHSYTAHAVGCNVADTSLKLLHKFSSGGSWDAYKQDWGADHEASSSMAEAVKSLVATAAGRPSTEAGGESSMAVATTIPDVWSVWSTAFLKELSHLTHRVDSAWALGSVLSISLKDAEGAGYTSMAAKGLQKQLLEGKDRDWIIHSRVLGNVLYLMTSQTSEVADVRRWESAVLEALKV